MLHEDLTCARARVHCVIISAKNEGIEICLPIFFILERMFNVLQTRQLPVNDAGKGKERDSSARS